MEEFLKAKGEDKGLGFWSKQSFESAHQDFKAELAKEMTSIDSSKHGEKKLRAVVRYNSKHV